MGDNFVGNGGRVKMPQPNKMKREQREAKPAYTGKQWKRDNDKRQQFVEEN